MERCRAIVLDMVDQVETGHQKAKPLMEICNLYPYCQETLLQRNNMGDSDFEHFGRQTNL